MTIREIARQAGVSIGTVDRALHGRGRVAPHTAEKIRRIAAETGFTPDAHASHLSTARRYSLTVLTPRLDQDGGFWRLSNTGIEKAAGELASLRVTVTSYPFDRYSGDSFRESARKILTNLPDGLILAPVLPDPALELLAELPRSVPCVLIDAELPTAHPLSFIGQDAYQSGRVAARLMSLMRLDPGRVMAIRTVSPDFHIAGRIAGFLEGFDTGHSPGVIAEERFEEPGVSERLMNDIFSSIPSLEGIFITNASSHRVAEYLERRFPEGSPVRVIGYDLTPLNRQYLERGYITFLISQRPELQAYEAVSALYRSLALRQNPSERLIMPIDILTPENVGQYT